MQYARSVISIRRHLARNQSFNLEIKVFNKIIYFQILLASNIDNSLLPGGLLHDIPVAIAKAYPNLQYFIEQCATPEVPLTRITAGNRLKRLLDTIIKEHK